MNVYVTPISILTAEYCDPEAFKHKLVHLASASIVGCTADRTTMNAY